MILVPVTVTHRLENEDKTPDLLKRHPLPWSEGEQHESMICILDAKNNQVCKIDRCFYVSPNKIAAMLIGAAGILEAGNE